jgi:hypothetical protein
MAPDVSKETYDFETPGTTHQTADDLIFGSAALKPANHKNRNLGISNTPKRLASEN